MMKASIENQLYKSLQRAFGIKEPANLYASSKKGLQSSVFTQAALNEIFCRTSVTGNENARIAEKHYQIAHINDIVVSPTLLINQISIQSLYDKYMLYYLKKAMEQLELTALSAGDCLVPPEFLQSAENSQRLHNNDMETADAQI